MFEMPINTHLDQKTRTELIQQVRSVYKGGSRWANVLDYMPDSQLIAFRNRLINSGKINLTKPRVSLSEIMSLCYATTFIVEFYKKLNKRYIYLGKDFYDETVQVGILVLSESNKIESLMCLGKEITRYKDCWFFM